jgi:RsiW-degrading membrane proteinase PrsW (M82 family)
VTYLWYIFFGIAPSIIWLLIFLRKDSHPESNRMILKIFFYGALATIPAALIEVGIAKLPLGLILYYFLGVALVEEVFKYLVVKKKVVENPEFDEPVDAMLYMIIAALGFAAAENILNMFFLSQPQYLLETFLVGGIRFVGATFLHALSAGLVGYYLALSFFYTKKRLKLITKGLLIAILLHGLYNLSIIKIEGDEKFIIPIIILISLAVFISFGFQKVKKLKSICNLASRGSTKS